MKRFNRVSARYVFDVLTMMLALIITVINRDYIIPKVADDQILGLVFMGLAVGYCWGKLCSFVFDTFIWPEETE